MYFSNIRCCRPFVDSFDLIFINLHTLLKNNIAKKDYSFLAKSALLGVAIKLLLPKHIKHLSKMLHMLFKAPAIRKSIIKLNNNKITNKLA